MSPAQQARKVELMTKLRRRKPVERFELTADPIDGTPIEAPQQALRRAA